MEKIDIKKLQANSHLFDGNFAYIEALYDAYLNDPASVEEKWRNYFQTLPKTNGHEEISLSDVRAHFLKLAKSSSSAITYATGAKGTGDAAHVAKQFQVYALIDAYRRFGHNHAKLDPLGLAEHRDIPELHLTYHNFTPQDLDQTFDSEDFIGPNATLRSIYNALNLTYCDTIGLEYMHISNDEEVRWIQSQFEPVHSHPVMSAETKKRIFQKLVAAEGLEKYLGLKYVGQKRFSLEGGGSLIPMMDELVQSAGGNGAKELLIGMAHRGRLNVLVNILGQSPESLFQAFEGKYKKTNYSGDVKYHMGFSSDVSTKGGVIHLALAFNPSHLEIIDPVIEGSVRARQDRRLDNDRDQIIPLVIHGDAAFAGQGVVMETLAFSQARGFTTGGTVHIVVNNQIGFTISNPHDARSSEYCTDIAKMIEAPIFHVNGDDPEACLFVTQVAFEYRMRFKKDVVIDLVCYRRHGHNEADEPVMTQPIMYRKIKEHPHTSELYGERLIQEKIINKSEAEKAVLNYRDALDRGQSVVEVVPKGQVKFLANWKPYKDQPWNVKVKTGVPLEKLLKLSEGLGVLPEAFKLHPPVQKEIEARRKMGEGEMPFNWGGAEILAYATLVADGYPVRLCGQDSARGTFSHRHSVLHDVNDGSEYIPLQNVAPNQANFTVVDSILSEAGVLGFEYGYATTEPEALTIWEAQFGDFVNGAQVVIDQFISSGEQKWGRLCGLTMYLPHGYEGQGPEHTSARLERFLQLCAQENMQVCVPTTPAQLFHMVRRQMIRPYRKPLIVMTPKSFLRHKLAVSTLDELVDGEFQLVIPEIDDIKVANVKRVVLCSGKVYYDLLQFRRDNKIDDAAILRIEQLYPFPKEELTKLLKSYKKTKDIIWCQEEPQNQGAWYSTQHRLLACLSEGQNLRYVGRKPSAAPSSGYMSKHLEEQAALVKEALEQPSKRSK